MQKIAGICALGIAFFLAVPVHGGLVNVSLSEVGDAGNAADTNGHGAVGYDFWMGTYEVSIGQYTTFLNTVASTTSDSYLVDLWNPSMNADVTVRGIARSGSGTAPDPYVYTVVGDGGADRPISYVSWFDAARFANWVNNGATASSSTETGAYELNGATSGIFDKESGALWWIPSQDEWYKAAYYQGGGTSAGYWTYPTQSNSVPGNVVGNTVNQANYFNGSYSVPGSGNKLTPGGAFTGSAGAYGTFDQGGNLSEWNDFASATDKQIRGGSWNDAEGVLQKGFSGSANPASESYNVGFRLASSVPEPSSVVLMVGTGLAGCLFTWRKRSAA